jgi:diacylglycerol kinase (ATP)
VAGGDGTLHHAVNALMELPAEERCPLWYLPFGTGNDFARTLNLSEIPPLELIAQALKGEGTCRDATVGRCNERYFLNMASGGLFATITPDTNPQLKSVAGRWSYLISGIGKLLERETIATEVDGKAAEPLLGFFVGNAKFAGGGIQIAADASPFREELEFLTVPDMPAPQLLGLGLELQKDAPDLSAYPVQKRGVKRAAAAFWSGNSDQFRRRTGKRARGRLYAVSGRRKGIRAGQRGIRLER